MVDARNRQVHFHGISFAPPETLIDTSVLSFIDRQGTPTLSLTVAQEQHTGGAAALKVYVDGQQRAAQQAVPGYAVLAQSERTVGGARAWLVEGSAPSPGRKRQVIQLYVLDAARERVFVVTATAVTGDAARARDAIEHIATTFTLEGNA